MSKKQKVDMIVDLQYGSTGKGLLAGYMALKNGYDICITANMPNAGHTCIDANDNKMVHKVLPNGVISPECKWALIGPGAVFDIARLIQEKRELENMGYGHFAVGIHPNATVLQQKHKDGEAGNVTIGSTMQGSGAAMVHKIARDPHDSPIAGHNFRMVDEDNLNELGIYIFTHLGWARMLDGAERILAEGAQGFSLGINERFYPYCTSRDCAPARFLSDMAIPVRYLRHIYGSARMHPIRVGNPPGGWSGPCYSDQQELTWEEVGVPEEMTTVTGRVRRVFSYSARQMEDAVWACDPDFVFLNFCNYDSKLASSIINHIERLGPPVRYTGWGPTVLDVREEGMNHGHM